MAYETAWWTLAVAKGSGYAQSRSSLVELTAAWQDRWEDAQSLLGAGRFVGAICNAIYALEILLKVRICDILDLDSLPRPFETHDLVGLLVLSGLSTRMTLEKNLTVHDNWDEIVGVSAKLDELRYGRDERWELAQAEAFLQKFVAPMDGVISWISAQP